jgi:hypothetical protein
VLLLNQVVYLPDDVHLEDIGQQKEIRINNNLLDIRLRHEVELGERFLIRIA